MTDNITAKRKSTKG